MTGFTLGCAMAADRLRGRFGAVALSTVAAFVLAVALLERQAVPHGAATRTLLGAVFGLAMPLFVYAATSRVCGGRRLDTALYALARHGADRRACALGAVATLAAGAALAFAALAALSVVAARGTSDPALVRDALTSAWIAALGAASYASWFALGSTAGQAGGGRFAALLADWLLGTATTALAFPWPRGHLRNLLGAEPVLRMSQSQASLTLCFLASGYLLLALLRSRR